MNNLPVGFLNDLVKNLMDKIAESYAQNHKIDDELLTSLHVVFPNQLMSALDLCDHHSVSLHTTPSGRKIYKCIGSSGTPYLIPYTGYICSCPVYKFGQIGVDRYCKHLIALMICLATGDVEEHNISEKTFCELVSECVHDDE